MCQHQPRCPGPDAPDRMAARALISRPEQGWSLLCNGIVLFEDAGEILPAGRAVPPPDGFIAGGLVAVGAGSAFAPAAV